nr:hypothetical protein [Tanacetum cinerariifolium]
WQRSQRNAGFPRHAWFELCQLLFEFFEEAADHVFMHEQDFQRGATLAVERQGTGDGFTDRVVQVDRADGLAAAAVNHVDDAGREAVAEGFEQRTDQQHAELGGLEHHGVAHDQRRNQGGEGFVQRVVVRPHAQGDAQRDTTNLAQR